MSRHLTYLDWTFHPIKQLSDQLSRLIAIRIKSNVLGQQVEPDVDELSLQLVHLAHLNENELPVPKNISGTIVVECSNEMQQILSLYTELISNPEDSRWVNLIKDSCTDHIQDVRNK